MTTLSRETSPALKAKFLEIGVLTKPHGLAGELKLRLHNEQSDALDGLVRIVVEPARGEPRRFEVQSVRGGGREKIIRLAGVEGRDAADQLRGVKVWVERALLPQLEPGEYYLVDLIGCSVVLEGETLGSVRSVRADPTVDTLVLQLRDGTQAELPLIDTWVGPFDAVRRELSLKSDDGLII